MLDLRGITGNGLSLAQSATTEQGPEWLAACDFRVTDAMVLGRLVPGERIELPTFALQKRRQEQSFAENTDGFKFLGTALAPVLGSGAG